MKTINIEMVCPSVKFKVTQLKLKWFYAVRFTKKQKKVMETDKTNINQNQEEEEYVLLDLDAVCGQVDIPPDEPYVLSGLDTLNPILTIGNKLKLIGEYEETVGTCLIFSENEKPPSVHEGLGSSEANLSKGTLQTYHNQNPSKLIKPVTSLHRILKFRLLPEADEQDLTGKAPDAPSLKEHL